MNIPYAVLDYSIANAEGAPRNRALMLGLVGGTMKSPMIGVLLAAVLGRQQQQPIPLGTTITTPSSRSRGLFGRRPTHQLAQVAPPVAAAPTIAAGGAAPAVPTLPFIVSFHGHTHAHAETLAGLYNLALVHDGNPSGKLEKQDPPPGAPIPKDRRVKLTWA